jgi:hypothetical protein
MQPAPAHAVPAGPLGVRWLAYELGPVQAGALAQARVELENAGAAAWHGVFASYHWLDDLGNAIDWDGLRTPLAPLAPGDRATAELELRAPMPPGDYRFAFDLVLEHRYWLSEIGNELLQVDVPVTPRDPGPAVAHLPPQVEPAPDWHELVRAAHAEGYTAVGGAIESRERELRAYRPQGGRNPSFAEPLVCPSLLPPLEPNCEVAGLPAWRPEGSWEPWIYDGRISARLRR